MLNKINSIYNKDSYDHSEGFVNPYEYQKTFYLFSKFFRVLDDEPLPKWTRVFKVLLVLNTVVAVIIVSLALYHAIDTLDIVRITECGTYSILFIYKIICLYCTYFNLPHYHNFLRSMREDFHYVCSDGAKYRKQFFESQLVTWKICIMCVVFMTLMGFFMVIFVPTLILYYMATHNAEDVGSRPLLFPLWAFGIDFSKTPAYEISLFYTSCTIVLYSITYIFMIQTQTVWVRQITIKADLITYCLEDLMEGIHPTTDKVEKKNFDKILKMRLKDIVKKHHSMYRLLHDFAGVYKKLLMFEQKLGGPVVCMTAYGSAEKLASGEFNAILMLSCITTFIVVLLPSCLCTFLGIKVRSICEACWATPFWNAGPLIRPYLIVIMQRSLRPLPLQAPGFEDVSLQTFSSKMGSAYSMFNMLRQTNLGH